MSYTFLDLAVEVIKMQNKPMSVYEIWNKAVEYDLHKKLPKFGKTPEQTLGARIYVSIKQSGDDSPFIQFSKRPALFYLKELTAPSTPVPEPVTEEKLSYKERDLHKILSSFVFSDSHFKSYTKTIYHEASNKKKKGKNEWLHPKAQPSKLIYNPYDQPPIFSPYRRSSSPNRASSRHRR